MEKPFKELVDLPNNPTVPHTVIEIVFIGDVTHFLHPSAYMELTRFEWAMTDIYIPLESWSLLTPSSELSST